MVSIDTCIGRTTLDNILNLFPSSWRLFVFGREAPEAISLIFFFSFLLAFLSPMTSGLRVNENERYTVPPITAGCLLRLRTFMSPLKILFIFLAWLSEQSDEFEVLSMDSWKKSLNKKAKKKVRQPGNVKFEQSASLGYKGGIKRNTKRRTFHLLKNSKA